MAKPTINRIIPFDAYYDKAITMTYFGDMAYSNKIVVYDAESMVSVFEDTVVSFSLEHIIPAYTLRNGVKYAMTAQMFDQDNIPSAISDKQYFWCLETPSFYFRNLTNEDVVESASYNATVIYEQADGEDISSYRFQIYNDLHVLLSESSTMYDGDDISYSFRGLESGHVYYIRCTGSTVNGIELDTGYVKLNVQYENPDTYARIYAECDEKTGVVSYRTNLISIEASTDEEFEYNDGVIDLIGKTLVYNDNFIVNGDFQIVIRGRNLYQSDTILQPRNDKYGIILSSYIYDDGQLRFKLTVPNGLANYIIYSNAIIFDNSDMVTITIKRVNDVYSLLCELDTEENTVLNGGEQV